MVHRRTGSFLFYPLLLEEYQKIVLFFLQSKRKFIISFFFDHQLFFHQGAVELMLFLAKMDLSLSTSMDLCNCVTSHGIVLQMSSIWNNQQVLVFLTVDIQTTPTTQVSPLSLSLSLPFYSVLCGFYSLIKDFSLFFIPFCLPSSHLSLSLKYFFLFPPLPPFQMIHKQQGIISTSLKGFWQPIPNLLVAPLG